MCAVSVDPRVVRNFTVTYLQNNPKATEDEVVQAAREHFQGKVSRSSASKVAPIVREAYSAEQVRANFVPVETPVVNRAAKRFNRNAAYKYYEELDNMGQTARHKRHIRSLNEAKAAFGSQEYLEVLKRNNPEEYAREVARLEEQSKPVPSNNANKKIENSKYESSKKRKEAKKTAEVASQTEKKRARIANSKPAREARYMTENGLMTTEGRKLYESIKSHEIIADAPWKSAEDSINVFIENGLAPLEEVKPVVTSTSTTVVENTTKPVANAVENAAEAATKAAKKAGKGRWGWIIGGATAIAAGALGINAFKDNKEQQQLNLSA